MLTRVRYFLIRLLVGRSMPVVMNMTMFRPAGYRFDLYSIPRPDLPGVFRNNELVAGNIRHARALLMPSRDVLRKDALAPLPAGHERRRPGFR